MHELRITLGLLVLTAAWLAIVPAAPTLVRFAAPVQPSAELTVAADTPSLPADDAAGRATGAPAIANTTATTRTVGIPSPVAAPSAEPPVRVAALPAVAEPGGDVKLQLFNRPVAVDAGTLKAGRTTLRVAEVQPISPDARCTENGRNWPCGIRARTAFRSWLRGRSVLCAVPPGSQDAPDLTVSCLAGEADIGEWLVANGWAAPVEAGRYAALGETAKAERRGIYGFAVAP